MAKKKVMKRPPEDKVDDDFFAELANETGGQVFADVGRTTFFIDTGNFAINYICSGKFMGGGIPGDKITEVYGPESSGKSLLGYCVLAGVQAAGGIGVYLDCERAGNADFASRVAHLDVSKLVVYDPPYFELLEKKVITSVVAIRAHYGPEKRILFVWDSIGVTMCEREWRETGLPENYTDAEFKKIVGGKEQPGERAKKAGALLRKLNPFLNENNAAMLVINQTREKIGVMFGDPTAMAGGGKALPYYASCRLAFGAPKKFEDKKRDIPLGVNLTVRNKKNRCFTPFLVAKNVPLFYDRGINPLGGLLSSLINAGRIEGKGMYTVLEPWAGGQDIKFKASKDRNDVDAEVLYKCPQLVDAASADEVRKYLGQFTEAIELTHSIDIEEVDALLGEDVVVE